MRAVATCGLRGARGVGSSELALVGIVTLFLFALAGLAVLVVWWVDRRQRRKA